MINVLRIDWDYFMNCEDSDRLLMFPDGGNESIGLMMNTYIWSTRYADSRYLKLKGKSPKEICDIGVKEQEFALVKQMILNTGGCKTMFADSHKDINDFIKEYLTAWEYETANVYNIDHHSDVYNIGDDLNCGNWVNKLDEEGLLSGYTWVRSDNYESIETGVLKCPVKVTNRLNSLKDVEWDLIFICRSSIWSPPHLDTRFNEFRKVYADMYIDFDERFFVDRFKLIEPKIQEMVNTMYPGDC